MALSWLFLVALSFNTAHAQYFPEFFNLLMGKGVHGLYTGNAGVLVRPMFNYGGKLDNTAVAIASLLVADIEVPSTVYPAEGPGGPQCPNNGDTDFGKAVPCPHDPNKETGPWNYAQLGVVVGSKMNNFFHKFDQMTKEPNWDWGVFYATDANSDSKRCHWESDYHGYDCPGHWVPWGDNVTVYKNDNMSGAAQFAPGNPDKNKSWGGGAGCHFADYNPTAGIDQTDAYDEQKRNIVMDRQCQCNLALRSGTGADKPWDAWVRQWIRNATSKGRSTWQKWFAGGKVKAPSFALNFAACWMNNPRDMIALQNAIWKRAYDWSNQKIPDSNWTLSAKSQRSYWGWNEVPVSVDINKPSNWDAIMIKLPLAICSGEGDDDTISCLSANAQKQLETSLERYINAGYLKVGKQFTNQQPGSSVAILREVRYDNHARWTRQFFCESWTSPSGKYKVVNARDGCYLDKASDVTGPTYSSIV